MREFVLAMRAAWRSWSSGEPLNFEGEHYRHTLMPPTFVPAPHGYGMPQVLVAGVGDAMTRVAGEVADGFLCHAFTTERWIREHTVPALLEGRRRAGQSMDGFTVKAAVFLATGTDDEIDLKQVALQWVGKEFLVQPIDAAEIKSRRALGKEKRKELREKLL